CKIDEGTEKEKAYSINFYVDSFNDVLLIGETNSSKGTIDGLTKINTSINTNSGKHQYELPSNNINIFDRNFIVVRVPSVGINKSKEITVSLNGSDCTVEINR
ncbi:hypothetical protein LJP68_004783, partial [Salmonella enterica]|nr:hypothetical protein [Salmonella enterica]EJU6689467.1 hypothetical protein [Salmonella enterica]